MRLSTKAKRWIAISVGTAAIALTVVWFLRWKILEDRVRAELDKVASELFDADIKVGTLRGSLLTSIQADDVVLRPRAGSPFREFTIKKLEIGYGLFGKGTLDVRITGGRFAFAKSKSDKSAGAADYLETAREISRFRFPGRLQAGDSILELPDGFQLHIENGEIAYGTWRLRISPVHISLKDNVTFPVGPVEAELEPDRLSILEDIDGGFIVAATWAREEAHLEVHWGQGDGDYLAFKGRIEPDVDAILTARLLRLDSPVVRAIITGLPIEGEAELEMALGGTSEIPTIDGELVFKRLTMGQDHIERLVFPLRAVPGALIIPRTTHESPVGPVTLEAWFPFPWVKREAMSVTRPVPPQLPTPGPDKPPGKWPDILPPTGKADPPNPDALPTSPGLTIEFPNVEGFRRRLPEEVREWIPGGRAVFNGSFTGETWKVVATFEGEKYRFPDPVGLLTEYEVEAELTPGKLAINRLKGMLGGGPIEAKGGMDLSKPGSELILDLKGSDVLIASDDLARIRINPDVKIIVSAGPEVVIKGKIQIPLALYYMEFGPAAPEGGRRRDTASPFGLRLLPAKGGGFQIPGIRDLDRVTLDVEVESKGECRIENSMIGAIVIGKLRLKGRASSPIASGRVSVEKGQVRLTSGLFLKINIGEAILPPDPGHEPYVRFEGSVGRFNREIFVFINGPMAGPTLRLQSNPPRSQEELLAMIAFGRTPGSVEGTDALGTLTGKVMAIYQDAWPDPEAEEGFFTRLAIDVASGAAERPVPPWELPTRGTARGTMVRTEYLLNEYLSIVGESDREANLTGDLKLRLRFK